MFNIVKNKKITTTSMKEIVYLTRYYLTKYNTAEYCTLMDRFINQTVATGADTLHYEEADMTRLRQLHSQLQNNVARTSASPETQKLQALDVERSTIGQHILSCVKNSLTLPIADKSAAATALFTVLKPYVGFYNQPAPQKTSIIDGMLLDLSLDAMQEHLTTLGLGTYIEMLTLKNAQYKVALEARTQARNANKAVDSATIRQEMDAIFDNITIVAFAHGVVTPNEDIDAYIAMVNAIIGEINTSYNQRMAAKTESGKGKTENSVEPSEPESPESPSEPVEGSEE